MLTNNQLLQDGRSEATIVRLLPHAGKCTRIVLMEIKTIARRLVHTTRRLQVYVCSIGSGNPERLLQFQGSHCNSRQQQQLNTLRKLQAPAVQLKKRQRPGERGRRHMVGAILSSEEFCAAAQQLAAAWQQFLPDEPQWHWVPSQRPFATSSGGGCLALQRQLLCGCERRASLASAAQQPQARSSSSSSGDDTQQEEEDPACALPAANSAAATLICHIAYHTSYRVPVLHFEVKLAARMLGGGVSSDANPAAEDGDAWDVGCRLQAAVFGVYPALRLQQ